MVIKIFYTKTKSIKIKVLRMKSFYPVTNINILLRRTKNKKKTINRNSYTKYDLHFILLRRMYSVVINSKG